MSESSTSKRSQLAQFSLTQFIERSWYNSALWVQLLRPLSWLFQGLALLRKEWLSKNSSEKQQTEKKSSAIVVVIGGITVGGSGKTPLLIAVAQMLTQRGYKVGMVSRGYGGTAQSESPSPFPLKVNSETPAARCGDEPALLAQRLGLPLIIDPNRSRAVEALSTESVESGIESDKRCDVILSDDGLQHYAMARDIELVVLDGARGVGNGYCLPAGPLREPVSRLAEVDFVISNGEANIEHQKNLGLDKNLNVMTLQPSACVNIKTGERVPVEQFFNNDAINNDKKADLKAVHGIAGIGHPQRFFNSLKELGCEVIEHPFADHHPYALSDLQFNDGLPVIMTEKDAVKCQSFSALANFPNAWYVEIEAKLPNVFSEALVNKISSIQVNQKIH